MSTGERIAVLMFRYVRNELTRAETRELTAWRNAHKGNERTFQGTTNGESILVNIGAFLAEKERGLQKLKQSFPEIWTGSPVRQISWHSRSIRIAAAILVIFGVCLYLLAGKKTVHAGEYKAELISADGIKTALSDFQRGFLAGSAGIIIEKTESGKLIYNAPNNTKKSKDARFMLRTDRGGEFILRFPDSTMVWINAETSIKYPANFSQDTINVSLEGEAYFEIPKAAGHYYTISLSSTPNPAFRGAGAERPTPHSAGQAPNAVQVGSSEGRFNLKSYPDDSLIFVTLVNGSASLIFDSTSTNLKSEELKPGEQARLMGQNFAILPGSDTAEIIAWKNGRTVFHNAGIQTIMQMVSRWYKVDVRYEGGIPEKNFSIDISRDEDLKVLIESLKRQGLIISAGEKVVTVVK